MSTLQGVVGRLIIVKLINHSPLKGRIGSMCAIGHDRHTIYIYDIQFVSQGSQKDIFRGKIKSYFILNHIYCLY